jgi:large subunit ribosomal protein L28
MSKFCEVCNKGPVSGHQVSHSNRKTKRKWLPNLQKVTITINGAPKTLKLCTRCIRTFSKETRNKSKASAL